MNISTFTAAVCGVLFGVFAKAEPYQVVTEEWAPYNYSEQGRLTGMATDIVQAIMALTGDDFEVQVLPSMRATHELRNRPRTIMYSLFRTAERESLYQWVGPIIEESIHPYQLAGASPPINSLEQLMRAPQVTTRYAGVLPSALQAQGFANLDKSAGESRQLYRMLLAGRTRIIAGDTDAGVAYYSAQLNIAPGTLRQIPVELFRSSLYIAFSRDSDEQVVNAWRNALEQLRQSGELARIQRRYERRR